MDLTGVLNVLFAREPALRQPKVARRVLDDLRKGQPPSHGILALTPNASRIEQRLSAMLSAKGATWQPNGGSNTPVNAFIRGRPGQGKTHVLRYADAAQQRFGAAVSWLETNTVKGRLDRANEWIPILLENMRVPLDGSRLPLRNALVTWSQGAERNLLKTWARQHKRVSAHREFAEDLLDFLIHDDELALGRLVGEGIPRSQPLEYQHRALARLAAVAELLVALGIPRLVLLMDQLETMERRVRDIRSRVKVYGYWHEPFSRSLPSAFVLWSVVPDQFTVLKRDLLEGRLEDYVDRDYVADFIEQFRADPWPSAEVDAVSEKERFEHACALVAVFLHGHGLTKHRDALALTRRDKELRAILSEFHDQDPTMRFTTMGMIEYLHNQFAE